MINNFNYTKENLEKLNIHDLRNLARDIGASTSPTTIKKDSLINLILMRSKGEIDAIESRMGRKPSAGINTLYDSSEFKPITKLTLHSPAFDYDIEPIETQVIFSFDDTNNPIIHFTENSGREYKIPIPESQMFRYNLKKGDVLTVKLRFMSENYYKYNVEKFIAINGVHAEEYDRDVFTNIPNV